jgi:hypothetical protein
VSADIVARLRAVVHNDKSVELMNREASDEIELLRFELLGKAEELARLRERVTMLVEAAAEDAERAARLERVITNKEPLL